MLDLYIDFLHLIYFRNYHELQLKLHPKINVFVGGNGQGKTNILEAIYVAGSGKSFRTNKDRDLIQFDKNKAYIKAVGKKKYGDVSVEIKLEENKKKQVKVNGIPLTKISELPNHIHVIVFSPEDLKLVKGGPSERRRFMDVEISRMKPGYAYYLNQYYKIMMQRNHLLKKIHYHSKYSSTIDIWNEKLVDSGVRLIHEKTRFIEKIGALSKLIHRKITNHKENLEIQYIGSVPAKNTHEETAALFKQKLNQFFDEDISRGNTGVGPHRDDIGVFINGIDARVYGSQGQQRTAALSLKLAEIELMRAETAEYPVLLLDDVFSELDRARQKFLIQTLKDVQILITTTEIKDLEFDFDEKYVFYVQNGKV